MKRNPALDGISLSADAGPVITESIKTAGDLFNLIEKALPSETERLIRLGYNEAKVIARAQKRASWFKIQRDLFRIRIKERMFDRAVKRGIPLDNIREDLLKLYNDIAD